MTERQLQFRVGLFAIVAMVIFAAMVFKFGEIRTLWEPTYPLAIRFSSAPGLSPGTPVRKNGVTIGAVREVLFDEDRGGVLALCDIRQQFRLRADSQPTLTRSLLGDASIEFSPGTHRQALQPGSRIEGVTLAGPMQIVSRMEKNLAVTLESFQATSREWQSVGRNVNSLLENNRENLDLAIAKTAESLEQFTATMRAANETLVHAKTVLGDPENQQNLKETLAALPEMVAETRNTISTVRLAIGKADENLENLKGVTRPLAERSTSMVTRLDNALGNLESLTSELDAFARLVNKEDGSIRRLARDPELYDNLNDSAASLAVLLKNLQPVMQDLRIFSDKIARHPELMGVSGAMKGSSGLKDPPPADSPPPLRQAGSVRPSPFPR